MNNTPTKREHNLKLVQDKMQPKTNSQSPNSPKKTTLSKSQVLRLLEIRQKIITKLSLMKD